MKTLKNGTVLLDTDNNPIHAHGGFMLFFNGFYYWYGEDRRDDTYVACYRSKDLENWEARGAVLTVNSPVSPLDFPTDLSLGTAAQKVNIERPKVIYCEETGKFVIWAHYENGVDYSCAAAAIATCDTPDGEFTYHGSFNPFGEMSRDCTLYKEDGVWYFISAANENEDLHIYRLTPDCLNVAKHEKTLFAGLLREAPALCRKDGKTFLLSSYCTGWKPNQGMYAVADSILGEWSDLRPFGDDFTYRSQPAFLLTLPVNNENQYIYVGDRWGGSDWEFEKDSNYCESFQYMESTYYFAPLKIEGDTVEMEPCDTYTLTAKSGIHVI